MKKYISKRMTTVFVSLLLFMLTGCGALTCGRLPVYSQIEEDGIRILITPDGKRFRSEGYHNPIQSRMNWNCKIISQREGKDAAIGRTKSGGRIYETEGNFCIHLFVPDGYRMNFFEEDFVFPKPKAEEFGEVVLSIKGEKTILKDEACIQAFLDRLLTREYDVKREAIDTTDKGGGTITFYSREYPKLSFIIMIYREKDQKKYYIVDWSNLDWIECTDLVEQYLSEYFE